MKCVYVRVCVFLLVLTGSLKLSTKGVDLLKQTCRLVACVIRIRLVYVSTIFYSQQKLCNKNILSLSINKN